MEQLPRVTVITVVRNDVQGFRQTAESVLAQDYPHIEYIVIDGGSGDGTREAIEAYASALAWWVSEPDQGPYHAMNKGLARATGGWVNFLNAGDLFAGPQAVSKVMTTGVEGYGVIYGDSFAQYPAGRRFRRASAPGKIRYGMPCCHQSVFVRRDKIPAGGFDPAWKIGADYDMLLKMYIAGIGFRQLPFPVAVFDATGVSNRNMIGSAKEHYAITCRHLRMTPWLRFNHYLYIFWIKMVMFGYRLAPRRLVRKHRGI